MTHYYRCLIFLHFLTPVWTRHIRAHKHKATLTNRIHTLTRRLSELFFQCVQFATFPIPFSCHNGISGQMDWSVSPVCWSWLEGFRFKTCWWPQVVALTFFFISSDFLFLFVLIMPILYFLFPLPVARFSTHTRNHLFFFSIFFSFWLTAVVVCVLWPLSKCSNISGCGCRVDQLTTVVKLSMW